MMMNVCSLLSPHTHTLSLTHPLNRAPHRVVAIAIFGGPAKVTHSSCDSIKMGRVQRPIETFLFFFFSGGIRPPEPRSIGVDSRIFNSIRVSPSCVWNNFRIFLFSGVTFRPQVRARNQVEILRFVPLLRRPWREAVVL